MPWSNVVAKWFPAVLHTAIATQTALAGAPGATKRQVVFDSILAGAQIGETIPIPEAQGISLLIDVVVQSLKAANIGGFQAKPALTPALTPAAAPAMQPSV